FCRHPNRRRSGLAFRQARDWLSPCALEDSIVQRGDASHEQPRPLALWGKVVAPARRGDVHRRHLTLASQRLVRPSPNGFEWLSCAGATLSAMARIRTSRDEEQRPRLQRERYGGQGGSPQRMAQAAERN